MNAETPKTRHCHECGNENIVEGVVVTQSNYRGDVALAFTSMRIFTGSAALSADVCRKCGTVLRFYVDEPHLPWITR